MGYVLGKESNQLKDFSVKVAGVKITNSQVNLFKMKWNIETFRVEGILSFLDITSIVENAPIRGGEEVEALMTDFDGNISKQILTIVAVSYSRSQAGDPITTLELLDPVTMKMLQMYKEMSWDKVDMVEMISHSETIGKILETKTKDFTKNLPKHTNFVMPLNVSFNVVAAWLAKNANVVWTQSRTSFIIKPWKELFSDKPTGDKFMYKTNNQSYRRNVFEFNVKHGKLLEATVLQPSGKVASFDIGNKHSKHTTETFAGAISKLGQGPKHGMTNDSQTATEDKYFYKSDYHVKETTEQQWSKNAYKDVQVEILVPGQFSTNIGDTVEIDMVNWKNQSLPESNINGLWLVTEIIDIVQVPDFAQRITLSRSKYFK